MFRTSLLLACALACAALAPRASAHAVGTSYLFTELDEAGGPAKLRWEMNANELAWNVFIDGDTDGVITQDELDRAKLTLIPAIASQLVVTRGGKPCAIGYDGAVVRPVDEHTVVAISLEAKCAQPGLVTIGGPLFLSGYEQRVMLEITRGGESTAVVLSQDDHTWTEAERVSAWASFAHFVGQGIWHVLIGYDHIAFVLLLLLPSVMRPSNGRWQGAEGLGPVARDIVTIVTAFTVAHSITLALAITGVARLPTQPIELAIAASIAVAAAINLMPRLSRARLPLAFGFGLVHGFGFANALSDLDAQGSGLVPLLAGFNIGVEIAQLAIVALVLPVIYAARRTRWYASGVLPLGSCALGAAGVVWLIQRL
jgi:hypothetical protein